MIREDTLWNFLKIALVIMYVLIYNRSSFRSWNTNLANEINVKFRISYPFHKRNGTYFSKDGYSVQLYQALSTPKSTACRLSPPWGSEADFSTVKSAALKSPFLELMSEQLLLKLTSVKIMHLHDDWNVCDLTFKSEEYLDYNYVNSINQFTTCIGTYFQIT